MTLQTGTNALGMDADVYTRGKPGDVDKRGESMVQKHAQQMQHEKENVAMLRVNQTFPKLGTAVKVVALQETHWNVDEATNLLKDFSNDRSDQLKALHKKRKRLMEEVEEAEKKKSGPAKEEEEEKSAGGNSSSSGSDTSSSSSSDSGSEDSGVDSDRGRKRKRSRSSKAKDKDSKRDSRKKSKHSSKAKKKEEGKKKKHSKKEKKAKGEAKGGKKEKKAKGEAKGGKKLTAGDDFGKFGLIRETDMGSKRSEFILWALEVKKVDVELLDRRDEMDLFKDYMEDFNTATFPHRKYYNLEAYEREKAAKEAAKGKSSKKAAANPKDDEAELRRLKAAELDKAKQERLIEAYKDIKYGGKGQDMKEQELLRRQMALAYRTGDIAKAQKLQERLAPEDKTKK